ncbi:hypothetical protein F2Q68_00014956 [Brassica cretica]|uniref:Uncharacterized protein n=2 Tax=Brassica cretica TaxID=69181 RepID=A0A8S9HG30_BRACR|nr:hypothetical protein F2Q68_00014956 [Brassica cretica]KAF3605846.1 hypothetical protein DY000_02047701 [Brassica cretica]
MANSFIILADLKAGRCSTRAEEVLSRKMEESSLLERFCSDSSLFASTQGRTFEKGFWYLEYLQHVFESRGFQFSDSDHAVGDSVESCKDESKPQKCPK